MRVANLRRWRLFRNNPRFVKIGAAVRYQRADLETWVEKCGSCRRLWNIVSALTYTTVFAYTNQRDRSTNMIRLMGLLSLALTASSACSHHKQEPSLCLSADVSHSNTNLRIRNLNTFDWHEVWISVNPDEEWDGFEYSLPNLVAGSTVDLSLREFVREDGVAFEPENGGYFDGVIEANEGRYTKELRCDSEGKR